MNQVVFYSNHKWYVTKNFSDDIPVWKTYKYLGWVSRYIGVSKLELIDKLIKAAIT